MRFKRLEIVGFKSFAEKTTLLFEPGVSAVVGPNGCGKSNVSDAIKWVLGEQSARSMRGRSMEDVIFNGTSSSEPVNLAEVSLILDNSQRLLQIEYDEVVLTRRLYRSGESEYYVNKNLVRLKDIQTMLMGTGMGINNYSIIEQGKIDSLISAKPENRRELFDEAAGITRYKSQKREALRKLEQVEGNLQRLADILTEVKRQIGSLERQARKAERYKKEFEVLKCYDVHNALAEKEAIAQRISNLHTQIEELRLKKENSEFMLQDTNRLLKEARIQLADIERAYSEIQMQQAVLEKDITNRSETIDLHKMRIQEYAATTAANQQKIEASGKRIEELTVEKRELDTKFQAILEESQKGEGHLNLVEEQYGEIERRIQNRLQEIEELKISMVDYAARKSKTQNDVTKLESQLNNQRARLNRLQMEQSKVSSEYSEIAQKHGTLHLQVEELKEVVREKIRERELSESNLEQAHTALTTAKERLNETQNDISSLESKLDVLEGIASRHEGFSQGVRFILAEERQGVIGTLADLVEVDRTYELAVESVLENCAQAVVCESISISSQLSKVLQDTNKGKASFLHLDEYASSLIPAAPDVSLNPLLRYMRCEQRVQPILNRLFEDTYLVTSVEEACELVKLYPNRTFVTRQGEVVRKGLFIGGMAQASEETLLFNRELRIRELRGKLGEMKLEAERLNRRVDEIKVRTSVLDQKVKAFGEEIPKIQMQLTDSSTKAEHLSEQEAKLKQELSVVDVEHSETEQEIQELLEAEVRVKAEYEQFTKNCHDSEIKLKENQEVIHKSRQQKESLLVDITRLRSLQDTAVERKDRAEKDLERTVHLLSLETDAYQTLKREVITLGERNQNITQEIQELETTIARYKQDVTNLLDRNASVVEKRQRWHQNVESLEHKKKEAEQQLIEMQQQVHDQEVNQSEEDHALSRLCDRMQANYQVDINGSDEELVQSVGEAPSEEEIATIRERLQKAGPVNLIAIEEYEELKHRYEFMLKEQADLLQAKDDFHKAILKINRTSREKFIDAFTKIQTHFVEYYKQLFGGGAAELVLMDDQNVLDSGIEIIARPPGKKLQSITLLSGGEKAMTAIALLFSVLKVKPTPFCILDEIDAPLDEANVQRFTSVLKDFVKGSQFIIITHNKRTMALADVMYGVTMQKTGTSRVVSVKFGAAENEVADNRKVFV